MFLKVGMGELLQKSQIKLWLLESAYARLGEGEEIGSPASSEQIIKRCNLDDSGRSIVEHISAMHNLSGRGIIRVLRVARTIADLDDSDSVRENHLYEAFMFRVENTLD